VDDAEISVILKGEKERSLLPMRFPKPEFMHCIFNEPK